MNRIRLVALSLFFIAALLVPNYAQETNPYQKQENDVQLKGKLEVVEDADLIDKLMLTLPGFSRDARSSLTEQSVRNFMMPPRTLGKRGSNISYTLAACLEFYTNFGRNYKVNLSPDYISLSIPKQTSDIVWKDGFRFLADNGTVSAAIMPFDAAAISTGVYATEKYTIDNFLQILKADLPKRQKAFEVRKALMRGNPVMIELEASEAFAKIEGQKQWEPDNEDGTSVTYPLIVVSFDQSREAFEVFNPWSPTWGMNGYMWMHYNDFGKHVQRGYVMVPTTRVF
ncbi:MAG: C1 family peptidase [Bacteroidota bacterium]